MQTPLTPTYPPFQNSSLLQARMNISNKKFAAVLNRLNNVTLKKAWASKQGELILQVYKPKDDGSLIIWSISKNHADCQLSLQKPESEKTPNSIVQIIRKYLIGRRIQYAYATLEQTSLILEFVPILKYEEYNNPQNQNIIPNCLILDFETRPPRICVAIKHNSTPSRYQNISANFLSGDCFFESFCEWSLEMTKTKRRPCFEHPLTGCCVWPSNTSAEIKTTPLVPPSTTEKQPPTSSAISTLKGALESLPTHVRRAAKRRLQFLERRLQRQTEDLPSEKQLEFLQQRATVLQAHLYLWPQGQSRWQIPVSLLELGLFPTTLQLQHQQKPSNLLEEYFHEAERMKRRRQELKIRIAESRKALENFENQVIAAACVQSQCERYQVCEEAQTLCKQLELQWSTHQQKADQKIQHEKRRLPYREYRASSGEFIRVAKSAQDGDAMLKLMPGHHVWLHVLTGEGSHVWLERPKKQPPSDLALRESSILAIHHSKQGRSLQGEVRMADRNHIDKKKDLPPGKVLIRRSTDHMIRYEREELEKILATCT